MAELLDLNDRLHNDPEFRTLLFDKVDRFADLETNTKRLSDYKEQAGRFVHEIFKDSGMNLSLLVPFYYPKFVVRQNRSVPLSLFDRPFNMALMYFMAYWTFTLRGSRQIGKSVTIIVRQRIGTEVIPNFKTIYVVPHSDQLSTYQRKFLSMERTFRFPVNGNKYKQNMGYREYPNGSSNDMFRINTSSAPARGKSADEVILDECQGMDPSLETDLMQVLNDSDIRIRLYTGTSLTTDTLLEARYLEGTQGTWHIYRGDNPHDAIDCGDPDQIIPCIKRDGLLDPKTGRPLNPLHGRFLHGNPDAFQDRSFSIHVPQVVNPDIVNNRLRWEELWKTLHRDKPGFIKECLGIPVEEADKELTLADMKRICVLEGGPDERKRRARSRKYYSTVVSGIDWGGSDYNPVTNTKKSFTKHAILGLTPEGKAHILHGRQYAGMDYAEIGNMILADHLAYGAGAIASDFGGGQVYQMVFRMNPHFDPSRHIIFQYSGNLKTVVKPLESDLENSFSLNRNESISALILAIVSSDPLLLCHSWEEFGDHLKDFLNLYRHLHTDQMTGEKKFRYIASPTKPDDFLHAVNFAYLLLRLVSNQPLIQDPATKAFLRQAILGGPREQVMVGSAAQILADYANS